MCTIVKDPSIVIKCSNPRKDISESITCMPLESSTRSFFINMIWVYANKSDMPKDEFMPSTELQSTLADTLNYFPILAGRVIEDAHSNAIIHPNNEGVLFTEAQCPDQTLDYFISRTLNDGEFDYDHINSSDLEVSISAEWTGPMMSIQVTRLQCGSVILSMAAFHCLMDAQSTADFINAWASGSKTLRHPPLLDKTFILLSPEELANNPVHRPSDCVFNRNIPPSATSSILTPTQQERLICRIYYFSPNELKNIKAAATKDLPSTVDYISTYDALYAHMILVIANATQTSFLEQPKVKILQVLNGRSRFVASHSSAVLSYFGSFPFWLYNEVNTTDDPPTLSFLAQLIHDMHAKQTEKSLKYYSAYLTSDDGNIRKNQADADFFNRDFYCTSWRKVNMLGGNFGGDGNDNYPIYSGPTKHLYPRYLPMMDAHRKDESVNIILGLREQDYQRLLEQKMIHKYR